MGQTAISGFYKIREIVVVVSSVIGMLTSNTELTCSQYKKKTFIPQTTFQLFQEEIFH